MRGSCQRETVRKHETAREWVSNVSCILQGLRAGVGGHIAMAIEKQRPVPGCRNLKPCKMQETLETHSRAVSCFRTVSGWQDPRMPRPDGPSRMRCGSESPFSTCSIRSPDHPIGQLPAGPYFVHSSLSPPSNATQY